jgi:Fe2+ or Zn2+ uptake regulation protein
MSFHNTINIAAKTLKEAKKKVNEQEALIMTYFKKHRNAMPTPWQVHEWMKATGHEILITSVRRGLTNLSDAGKLIKSDVLFQGPQGKPNHAWMLNAKAKKAGHKEQGTREETKTQKTKPKKQHPKTTKKANGSKSTVQVKAHTRNLKPITPNPHFHQQTLSI